MMVPCAKFGQILGKFFIFQILILKHRKLAKGLYIWIQHDEGIKPKKFQQFWIKNRSPKGKKNYQKGPLCLFLDARKQPWAISLLRGQITSK